MKYFSSYVHEYFEHVRQEKFEFGATIFEVNHDVITYYIICIQGLTYLHTRSYTLDFNQLRLSQQCAYLKFAFGATTEPTVLDSQMVI